MDWVASKTKSAEGTGVAGEWRYVEQPCLKIQTVDRVYPKLTIRPREKNSESGEGRSWHIINPEGWYIATFNSQEHCNAFIVDALETFGSRFTNFVQKLEHDFISDVDIWEDLYLLAAYYEGELITHVDSDLGI